jgi:ABC-2 type transport system ATP-binding protein
LKKALREIFMRHIMRPMEPGPAAINVHQLTRRFGESLAVNRLSFDVASGAICGVVGPNGAGKSTTFRILCGLLRPTSGTVTVLGRDVVHDPSAVATCVGLLPETPHFYPYMTGEKNLWALAQVSPGRISRERCAQLLELTGLSKAATRAVSTYSAGMKLRLALAAALLTDPPVLLLDEPTAGLDPTGALELRALIRSLAAEGRTILMATQALDEAERTCTQLIVLSRGELRANVQVRDLLAPSGLRMRVSPVADALRILNSLDGVRAAVRGGDDVNVEHGAIPTHVLVRALVLGGVDVSEVTIHRETLEHHFLQLTADRTAAVSGT